MKPRPVLYIVDDDPEFLNAMALLGTTMEMEPRTFERAIDFLAAFEPGQVGCALVDRKMPRMNGMKAQIELTKIDPEFPFIMLTGHADIPSAIKITQNGAFGFLEKPIDPEALKKLIRKAVRHSSALNPARKARDKFALLTGREGDVFGLVVLGFSNQKIGDALSLNIKTVEQYRSSMMKKLRAKCLKDLIAFNAKLTNNKAQMRKAS